MTQMKGGETTGGGRSTPRSIPDVASWKPRDTSQTLANVFASECGAVEQRLLHALRHERRLAVDGFDSGLPFESHVRRELGRLLPRRYSVTPGRVVDRDGKSAGHCDAVIFNDFWFSPVKPSATDDPNHSLLPIEGVYAVGEIKQTLSTDTLDQAMEKLVKCHRLNRPRTFAHRIVENREGCDCPHGLTNPLFSFVLAGAVAENENLQALIERFFDISRQLKRLEVVRALCVLGEGTVVWSFYDPDSDNQLKPALFVEADLFHPIVPTYAPANVRSPLYSLLQMIQLSLFHVVLGPEDLEAVYGLNPARISVPASAEIALQVEDEWSDLLNKPCSSNHS